MSDRLRICMVTTFYPPYGFGGDAVFVRRLSRELARRGHDVHVVHCLDAYRACGGREPATPPPPDPGVTVHRLDSGLGLLSPLATQQAGRPLFKSRRLREVLAMGFDVIHYHNVSLVGGPKVLEFGEAAVKLYTMHEAWLICPTHVLYRFNRAPCEAPHCFACTLAHRRPVQWWRYTGLLGRAVRHVDRFLAPSAFTRDIHRERGFHAPISVLPNFVPLPAERGNGRSAGGNEPQTGRPSDSHGPPEEPYFLFVGRLERVKGLHTLVPVMRRWGRAPLLVAGAGSAEAALRRLAGGAPNVRFLGWLPAERLAALYRGAAAVIVPSVTYEVFPLVALEALSHGTPIIVRRLGGLPEIAVQSGGGLVYEDDAELVAALDAVLDEPARRERMGRLGREAVRREWSADAHLERYFQIIDAHRRRRAPARP
ncbi:MAG: glycosyltransferase family 4 protein [Rhodothermales bacterium]|nr:glycosyltransferase family 4 protein [Rhodothermales bacterium]